MPNPDGYERISVILAELKADKLHVPDHTTVRRWVQIGSVRAQTWGVGNLLVCREDVRRMVTPTPVGVE